MKKIAIFLAAMLLLTGCQIKKNNAEFGTVKGSALQSGNQNSMGNTGNSTDSQNTTASKEATAQEATPASPKDDAPKEANWTLSVNDTVDIDIKSIKISYTLSIQAEKQGGTTDLGTYTGTATLKQKMDASGLSAAMVNVTGGVDTNLKADNVQIELVGYDREKYDNFGLSGDEPPLSNLSEADGMALGAFTMSGSGKFDVSADAPNAHANKSFSKSGTGEMAYKINVEGGQVSVSIPMLNIPGSFKGMITGVPLN